jgi:aspartyl-tRNA(Asn)/glutamyl-tRNA(Gln) amidotransferase subunit A
MSGPLRNGELETAREISAALLSGDDPIADILERVQSREAVWRSSINAFSNVSTSTANMNEASRVPGEVRGSGTPLKGIPIAIKDLFDVQGYRTTGCCAAYQDGQEAHHDAPTVARVREAGLHDVGKTNQHELAAGGTNLVSACGRTGNPWDPARMTGGSSGGSAAAVAAGIVPWALGSDTGGSIRIPASMCGTYGLKPTTGQITTDGMMPLAPSMDCPGPLAMTADDLWVLYRILAGLDLTTPLPSGAVREREFRIGIPGGFFADRVHDETKETVRQVALCLEEAGAVVEPVDGDGIDDARRVWLRVCTPEFAGALFDWERRKLQIAPSVVEWLEMGRHLTADDRNEAARRREEIRAWFLSRLERFDALLVPTTAYPAPRADQTQVDLGGAGAVSIDDVGPGFMTCSVNLANLPAMNIPAGWSSDGMPIGVSILGRPDAEPTLFAIASLWETATGYRPRHPANPTDAATL